jgi:energy-coupling factor transporter transmembrane protein EcfT
MTKIKSNPAKTMLTISMGFLVVYLITQLSWALITSLCIGILGMFSTFISKQIEKAWFNLAWVLGLIIPNILLTIIFYGILFPIALLSRLFRETDSMKFKNKMDSTYTTSTKDFDQKSFENPW